ncbi:hypothetical protein ACIB24_20555 [Spongisporangium articulatum]|uniref:Uncharacterized protein n=1 Tax=Spongisporangium articulatum TaxID=3362603 RepID=A0ABW8ATZ4_9ACTN
MSEQPDPHEAYGASAGPWLDDVRRVLDLVESFAGQAGQAAGEHLDDPAGTEHSPECTWCPVCRAMRAARRSGPEVLERIAEIATGLAASLREQEAHEHDVDVREEPEPVTVPDPPTTVRIDITD